MIFLIDWCFSSMLYCDCMDMEQHLRSRWFDPGRYSGVWIEPGVSVTVAMWNFSGQMVGYQKYQPDAPRLHDNSVNSRYHTWFGQGLIGCWGMESLDWRSDVVFLVEGIFNASRLHWHKLPALALIANDPKHLGNWLSMLPHRRIAALDGDAASIKLTKYAHQFIQMPPGEDVSSLSENQFQEFFAPWL